MPKNILNLLILCGILCQGLPGTSAEADIGKPSDVLVRHKRVFYTMIHSEVSMIIQDAPYIVNIKLKYENYEVSHCVGSIIMAHVIITAAQCASHSKEQYSIYSQTRHSHNGTYHNVIDQKQYFNTHRVNTRQEPVDGIALMFVEPRFTFASSSSSSGAKYITINRGPIPTDTVGTISGWGYCSTNRKHPEKTVLLQSITVRTIDNVDCANRWRGSIQLSPKDICTYDPIRVCGHSDIGAPLVINRKLVGVHIISGGVTERINPKPDIFAFLDHPDYHRWVNENIHLTTQ